MLAAAVKEGQDPQDVGKLSDESRLLPLTPRDRRTTQSSFMVPLEPDRPLFYLRSSLPVTNSTLFPNKVDAAPGKVRTPTLERNKPEASSDELIIPPPMNGKDSLRCDRRALMRSDSWLILGSNKVDCQTNIENAKMRAASFPADGKHPQSFMTTRSMKSSSSSTKMRLQRPRRSVSSSGLEWLQNTEIYNVASTKIRSMLQRPVSLNLKVVPEGVFAGPLLEIFPDSAISRRSGVNQAEWDEVMRVGKWSYPAEDSGLVTFWQAILVNVHWLRCGLGALLSLTSEGCHTARDLSQLFDCVTYPMGQLVNAIGLSWEYHHARNLKKMNEADRQRINIQSLSHRHDSLKRKSWAVLLKLQGLTFLKTQAEREQAVHDAHKKFEEFYIYLIYTVRVIMEDTLFLYRSSLNEQQMGCLGDTRSILSDSSDADELIWQAWMVIAGGTPPSHWKKRFDHMGHGWLARQTTLKLALASHHRMFLKPIKQVQNAAQVFKDVSSKKDVMRP